MRTFMNKYAMSVGSYIRDSEKTESGVVGE